MKVPTLLQIELDNNRPIQLYLKQGIPCVCSEDGFVVWKLKDFALKSAFLFMDTLLDEKGYQLSFKNDELYEWKKLDP